ncbi:MAG: hypothetical protein NZL98_10885, partial [Anaerolineales bacterium]|nr:hypothetical protein [Anaerolineales bacterium]
LVRNQGTSRKSKAAGETIWVNGKLPEKDFISQALQNSRWLREAIRELLGWRPWITTILLSFTDAFVSPTKPIKGVYVVNKKIPAAVATSDKYAT